MCFFFGVPPNYAKIKIVSLESQLSWWFVDPLLSWFLILLGRSIRKRHSKQRESSGFFGNPSPVQLSKETRRVSPVRR